MEDELEKQDKPWIRPSVKSSKGEYFQSFNFDSSSHFAIRVAFALKLERLYRDRR